MAENHTALTWLLALATVAYTTLGNYLVGLTPEENHWRKGEAWSRVGAYRWAAWHFRKFLTYTDDPRVRPHLGWCYAQMGMLESAIEHYRQAYVRNKHPDVALGLAQLEAELGNVQAARALVQTREAHRHELSADGVALLDSLERRFEPHQDGRRPD
jgi:tetratricopeptide (TPR) repeat protein